MMYIEPQFQLPEKAQSLHAPVDWQAVGEQFAKGFLVLAETVVNAFATVVMPIVQTLGEAIEDATRSNAYHPQGLVIRSTAFGLPDDMPPVGQKLLEPPYTVMHEGQPVFINFGTIEQIRERLK